MDRAGGVATTGEDGGGTVGGGGDVVEDVAVLNAMLVGGVEG